LNTQPAAASDTAPATRPPGSRARTTKRGFSRLQRLTWQVLTVLAFLAAWEWVPAIPGITNVAAFLDPFFISSPQAVAKTIWELMIGDGVVPIWSQLGITITAALGGTAAGVIVGGIGGLLCGGSKRLYEVVRPLVMALNAIPRITLVPVVVLLFGTSMTADGVTSFMLVIFIVFYNAVEGARSVSLETMEFVRLLGASPRTRLFKVRGPYAAAWVFASLPNALSFGLVGAVTSELFTGSKGVGQLMVRAVDTANASLTFAVVVILAVVGIVLVQGVDFLRRKLLSWWDDE